MNDFGLYVVMTDPVVGYERCCEAAVKAGVRMVQLRMKDKPRDEIVSVAKDCRSITRNSGTVFIVDDDPSIAAEVGADGVHVGQDDMPVADVRRLYPSIGIVGLSTHNLKQAIASENAHPDYIGVGPVYATPTKKIPDPVLGVASAARMIDMVEVPAVAIGGMNIDTIPSMILAGARNIAVVRPVCQSPDPYSVIVDLQRTIEAALEMAAK